MLTPEMLLPLLKMALAKVPPLELDHRPEAQWSDTSTRLKLNSLTQVAITKTGVLRDALAPVLTTYSDRASDAQLRSLANVIIDIGRELADAAAEDDAREGHAEQLVLHTH